MTKDKIIKDLKERNAKLKNQNELKDIRICHLEQEITKLKTIRSTCAFCNFYKNNQKYSKIKEMFESGVVDLEELKNIVLGDGKRK